MKTLLRAIVLLLVVIAVFGYFRGWYIVSTDGKTENMDHNPSATITMDSGRIKEDENRAKEAVQGFGHKAKEAGGGRTETVR